MKDGKFVQNYCRLKGRGHSGYPDIYGDNIKVYIQERVRIWIGLALFRVGSNDELNGIAGSRNRK